jgi:APA family basic amino acid/polyamine antiporter
VPVAVTIGTAIIVAVIAAFLPLAEIAALANAGTLCAFVAVGVSMMVLRRREPHRARAFRVPAAPLVAFVGVAGCLALFATLPGGTQIRFLAWNAIGLAVYFGYARRRSLAARR